MRNINSIAGCVLLWCLASAYRHGDCREASYERESESLEEDDDDLQAEASMTRKTPLIQHNKDKEEDEDDEDLGSDEGWHGGNIYHGSWWDGWARGWYASVRKHGSKDKKYIDPKEKRQRGLQKAESQIKSQISKGRNKKPYTATYVSQGYPFYGFYGGYSYHNPYYYGRYGYKQIPYGRAYTQSVPYYGRYGQKIPYYARYMRPYIGHHQIYGHRYGSLFRRPYMPMYRG